MHLVIHSDGGARGNPGPAAIGVVISDQDGRELQVHKEYIGSTTNNQAEYKALLKGLTKAVSMQAAQVDCYLDSELVVKQLKGLYKIREPGLQPLAAEILKLTAKFKSISFNHVPRAKNARADQLVNEALDAEEKE